MGVWTDDSVNVLVVLRTGPGSPGSASCLAGGKQALLGTSEDSWHRLLTSHNNDLQGVEVGMV